MYGIETSYDDEDQNDEVSSSDSVNKQTESTTTKPQYSTVVKAPRYQGVQWGKMLEDQLQTEADLERQKMIMQSLIEKYQNDLEQIEINLEKVRKDLKKVQACHDTQDIPQSEPSSSSNPGVASSSNSEGDHPDVGT